MGCKFQHYDKNLSGMPNMLRLGRLVVWAESSASVRPRVEAGAVSQVVPRLLLELHGGADLLEVASNVYHSKHGDEEEGNSLQHDVEGKDQVDVGRPGIAPPLRSRVGRVKKTGEAKTENSAVTRGRHSLLRSVIKLESL